MIILMSLVMAADSNPSTLNESVSIRRSGLKYIYRKQINRVNPYTPSLSSTPASCIEPSVGASTWAFGSQKCNV